MEGKVYISTRDLAIGYKHTVPLASHLDLQLRQGDVVSLVGRNGIGKSTLMRTLCGELAPLSGRIEVMGESLASMPRHRLATRIAIADTTTGMSGGLRVRQLVELGRQPYTGMLGLLKGKDKEVCRQAMEDTGIYHKRDAYVSILSDGERQKATIARALAQDTPVIYLDEPFSFLDPSARLETMSLLVDIARGRSKAILLTCHDVALSLRMASRLWLFTKEGTVCDSTPAKAVADGLMDNLYESDMVSFSPEIGDFIVNNSNHYGLNKH